MADAAAPKPKTVKPKGDKKPTTQSLVKDAILALKERSGSSPMAIKKYLANKTPVESSRLSRELKKMVEKGLLVKVKASYKLTELAKKGPAKPKKKAVKKATKPKSATAPKVKKSSVKTEKKPATKTTKPKAPKTVKPKTASATKKPATKKPATKKPSVKTAPKKTKPATKKPTVKKTPKKQAAKAVKA